MRLGVLCSGNGTNFENILRSCWEDEVVLMIHNKKDCGAAKRADKFGVPHCYIKHKDEELIIQLMQAWRVDLIVLAGYMQVISPTFVHAFPNRIINLHPSLLPKYKGLHAIEQALESGDKETGCTVHYVNDELDSRPLAELPDTLFGKVIIGVAGYNPIWKYITIAKQDLIEEINKKK